MAKTSKFDAAEYLDSPEGIADYLSEALETGDSVLIAEAIGTIARSEGMTAVAAKSGLSRENLYRALDNKGNPEFGTVMKVVDALGLQLIAKPKAAA